MSVLGLIMVKDEVDVLPFTLDAMAVELDGILAIDNGSTDGSREVLAAHPAVIELIDDPEVGYYQSARMTGLARRAIDWGARWVVPFDADERWVSTTGERIADFLATQRRAFIVTAELFDHVTTDEDDVADVNPLTRIRWRRLLASPLPKVAVRLRPDVSIEMGNHGARFDGLEEPYTRPGLAIRHFPWRSDAQVLSKITNGARAYAATDLPETYGAHWRGYGRILAEGGPEALLEGVYRAHFHSATPRTDETLVLDPCP